MEGGELDGKASANSQMALSSGEVPSEVITDDFVGQPRIAPVKVEPPDVEPQDGFHSPLKKEEIITDDVPPQMNLAPIPLKLVEAATGKLIQYQPVVDNPDDEADEVDSPINQQEPLVLIKQEPDENASDDDDCSHELPYCPTELVQTSFGTYDMPEVNAKKDGLTERQLQKQAEKCISKGADKRRKPKRPCRQSDDVPDELTSERLRESPGEISPSDPRDERGQRSDNEKPRVNRIIISAKKSTRKDGTKVWECYEVETIDDGTEGLSEHSSGCTAELGGGTEAGKSSGGAKSASSGVVRGRARPSAEGAPPSGRKASLRRRTLTPDAEVQEEAVVRILRSRGQKKGQGTKGDPELDKNGYYEELGFKLRRLSICVLRMTPKEIEEARNTLLVKGRKRKKVSEGKGTAESKVQSSPYFPNKRAKRFNEAAEPRRNQTFENRRSTRTGGKTSEETEGEGSQRSGRLGSRGRGVETSEYMPEEGICVEKKVLSTRKGKGKLVPEAEVSMVNVLNKPRRRKRDWNVSDETPQENVAEEYDKISDSRCIRRVDGKAPEDEESEPPKRPNVGKNRSRRTRERELSEETDDVAEDDDHHEVSQSTCVRGVEKKTPDDEESEPAKRPSVDKTRRRRTRERTVSEDTNSENEYQGLGTGKRKTRRSRKRYKVIYEECSQSPGVEIPSSTTNEDAVPNNLTEEDTHEERNESLGTLESGRGESQISEGHISTEEAGDNIDESLGNQSDDDYHDETPEYTSKELEKTVDTTEEDNIRRLENFCKTVNTPDETHCETLNIPEERTKEEADESSSKTPKPANPKGSRRSRRKDETPEERRERLQKAKEARLTETPEQKKKRLEFLKACQKKYLARETEEQRRVRLEKMKAYQAKRLANESPEQRERRLQRARQYVAQHTPRKKTSSKGNNMKLNFEEGRDESTSAYGSEPGKSNEDDDHVEGPAMSDKWVAGAGESQVGWNYGEPAGGLYNKGVAGTVPAGGTLLGAEEYGRGAAVDRYVNYGAFDGEGVSGRGTYPNQNVGEACPNVVMGSEPVQSSGERHLNESSGAREERLSSDVQNVKRLIVSAMHATDYDSHKAWNDRHYSLARETQYTDQSREEPVRSDYFVNRVGSEGTPNAEVLQKTKHFGRRGEKPTMMNWGRGYEHQNSGLKTKGMLKGNYYSGSGGRCTHAEERNVYNEGYAANSQGSVHGGGEGTPLNRSVRVEDTFVNSGAGSEVRPIYGEGYAANTQSTANSVEGTTLNRSVAIEDGFVNRGVVAADERNIYGTGYSANTQSIVNSGEGTLNRSMVVGNTFVNRDAESVEERSMYGIGYAGNSQGSVLGVAEGTGLNRSVVAEDASVTRGVQTAEERNMYGGYAASGQCTVSCGEETALNTSVVAGEALVNRVVEAAEERNMYAEGYSVNSQGNVNRVGEEEALNRSAVAEGGFVNRDTEAFGNGGAVAGGVVAGGDTRGEEMVKSGSFDREVERAVLGNQEGLNASDIIEGSADEGECNSDELIRSDVVEWQLDSTGLDAEEFDKSEPSDWESSQDSYVSERSREHTDPAEEPS